MRALSCGASCLQKRAAQGDPAWECRAGWAERNQRQWDSLLPCHRSHQLSQQVLGRAGRRPLILPEHASSRESSEGQTLRQGRSQQAKAGHGEAGKSWLRPAAHSHLPLPMNYREEAVASWLQGRPCLSQAQRSALCSPTTHYLGSRPHRKGQVPLPAQTCPGAHCLRSKGSINSLGRHLWPFHLATTNPSRKTSF